MSPLYTKPKQRRKSLQTAADGGLAFAHHVFHVHAPRPHPTRCKSVHERRDVNGEDARSLTHSHQHHNLWYSSRNHPSSIPPHLLNSPHDPTSSAHDGSLGHNSLGGQNQHPHHHHHHHHHPRDRDHRRMLVERTPLSRLRQDELLMERRRQNVSNYGSSWLKPPGVPKTLFQMREERREAEEHAEQVRREQQLTAALEAEAGAGGEGMPGEEGVVLGEDDMLAQMEEDEMEQEQDLDDEIPEAEGFGFDGEDDSEEEDDEEEEEDEENDSEVASPDDRAHALMVSPDEQEQVRDMRAAEDRMRELMERGQGDISDAGGDPFLDADDVALESNYTSFHHNDDDDERAGQMLEEDDLISQHYDQSANIGDMSMGMDMDMDADLDDEIPEGDDEYEHTDSDVSDDEDGTREISFAGRSSTSVRSSAIRRRAPRNMLRQSLQSRASLAQSDYDISGLLSGDGSSFLGETPQTGRRRVP